MHTYTASSFFLNKGHLSDIKKNVVLLSFQVSQAFLSKVTSNNRAPCSLSSIEQLTFSGSCHPHIQDLQLGLQDQYLFLHGITISNVHWHFAIYVNKIVILFLQEIRMLPDKLNSPWYGCSCHSTFANTARVSQF